MRFDGFLFDLDGTLADSMPMWEGLLDEWLARRGLPSDKGLSAEIVHMTAEQSALLILERYALTDTAAALMEQWTDMTLHSYACDIAPKPGAVAFVKRLCQSGAPIALASSCLPRAADAFLKAHSLDGCIEARVFTDEVGFGKERPDVYLEAARRLGVNPKRCVVFEDIPQAVKGVREAGMALVGVEDGCSDQRLLSQEADLFIADFWDTRLSEWAGL